MKRPLGVVLLVILASLSGIANLVLVATAVQIGDLVLAVLAAIAAGAALAVGYGAWTARRWAWPLSVAFFGLSALSGALAFAQGGGALAPVIIGVLAIGVLLQPNIRAYFGRGERRSA